MEDEILSDVPVAELAWPNLQTFAAPSPAVDFTKGVLDPANQFSQFMRHVVRQLQMCAIYTDEDILRWLVNYEGRQSKYLPVQPQDYLVLRCFAVLCSEMPDVVCRHWDMPLLETFNREDMPILKSRIAQGLRYAMPMPYSETEAHLRKRPRDTNIVTPTLSHIS
jgi:hypothetical protein